MEGSCLELVLEVTNDGEPSSEIERPVTPLATLCREEHLDAALFSDLPYPADELAPLHRGSIGQKCPNRKSLPANALTLAVLAGAASSARLARGAPALPLAREPNRAGEHRAATAAGHALDLQQVQPDGERRGEG
jgi:hypothetical protein